jgi:chemotaxis protein MotB
MAKAPKRAGPLPPPVIIKKINLSAAAHHGGAWKVAYADFVTAMMAFFLLLWLLGATTEKQRKGIADYFSPTLVRTRMESAGSGKGMLGGASLTEVDNYPNRAGQTGEKSITIPRDTTGGPRAGATPMRRFAHLHEELDSKLDSSARLRALARRVKMVDTTEGVRIDMVDDAQFSMFRLGTTMLTPDAVELLKAISDVVRDDAGGLSIRGHTDALPWRLGNAGNNWALSAGRAEATREALMSDGIPEDRFRRIEGVADRELLVPQDPHDPRNRRISITVMQ